MPFVPHTAGEVQEMLNSLGETSIEALFDEIPPELRLQAPPDVGPGSSEMEMLGVMTERAALDEGLVCFAGAGAGDHYIPAAVWDLVGRGEFMTAYTPYQAEASQGTLQLLYEYQSMMSNLTAMEVANASLYDGGSGLAEAVLMAVRASTGTGRPRILVAGVVNPRYLAAARSITQLQGIELEELPPGADGRCDIATLQALAGEDITAILCQQPNFLGNLEAVDAIQDFATAAGALSIAVINPLAAGLLKPPGQWGTTGADIAVGDGQPLGIPLASGGPYFGFLCCRKKLVRQMPGRLVGRTLDREGTTGYTLTLQAREQHIRRSKATSNICTNQGLLVTAATIYLSLMGAEGLRRVASQCHANTRRLVDALTAIPGVRRTGTAPFFHEAVLDLPRPAGAVVEAMARHGILAGVALDQHFPDTFTGAKHGLLVCATEKRTDKEIDAYATALTQVLQS